MNTTLLSDIERFMADRGIGEHRFGMLAAKNGRLVERLRNGGRIWPETEARVRAYMLMERARTPNASAPQEARAE